MTNKPSFAIPHLRQRRIAAWLSRVQLGERAGMSGETIRRLECGSRAHMSTVVRLAQALSLSPDELVYTELPVRG